MFPGYGPQQVMDGSGDINSSSSPLMAEGKNDCGIL